MRTSPAGTIRFNLVEASGALGDLGTFLPLVISLVAVCHLDLGSVLIFAGLYNIATGFLFRQPIPVQPMKAISAVAIAEVLSPGSIAAAGLGAGTIVLVLGLTGGVGVIERVVPRPVVRGIQLGVGLKLLIKGVSMILASSGTSIDGWGVAVVAGAFVLLTRRWAKFPAALILFVAGLVLMMIAAPETFRGLSLGWSGPVLVVPDMVEWKTGLLRGALPQIPLTLLNSVIAVCALSADLYPGRGIAVRPMAISVGMMNIVGCWFGAMPMCHGAGGLAGQHSFGARTGGSVIMLGAAKVVIGLGLGASAMVLLGAYPLSILGVLLVFAGAELALPARNCATPDEFFLATLTAGGCLGFNTSLGFAMGIVAAVLLSLARGRRVDGSRNP